MSALTRTPARAIALLTVAALASIAILASADADASLVAPGSDCPGQQNVDAPEPEQEDAMRCLIDHARREAGIGGLSSDGALERAAGRKVGDVFDCGFSHTACGRPGDMWAKHFGYGDGASSWAWGENLAWGKGDRGSARNVLKAWLNSPPHRDTLLTGSFEHLGLGLKRGHFSGQPESAVWVLQVGCRGC
jgi:uncharacterized protein YkwD